MSDRSLDGIRDPGDRGLRTHRRDAAASVANWERLATTASTRVTTWKGARYSQGSSSQEQRMAKKRWHELSPRTRQVIVAAAAIEGALKVAALIDLKQRSADQVRGSKKTWAATIILVNSGGLAPLAYFFKGRRQS
jgi:hypothetical protein